MLWFFAAEDFARSWKWKVLCMHGIACGRTVAYRVWIEDGGIVIKNRKAVVTECTIIGGKFGLKYETVAEHEEGGKEAA